MTETPETTLKRLAMRSSRRGIKEMDLILSAFAERRLGALDAPMLRLYDLLLSENDQDLYQWVIGQTPPPDRFVPIVNEIRHNLREFEEFSDL